MAKTRAQENRAIRQQALREKLENTGLVQQYLETIGKIEGLDPSGDNSRFELDKLKVANEQRLKMIDKYLPSVKAVEHTGSDGSPLSVNLNVSFGAS